MNDDLKIAWNLVGYPGVSPAAPYVIHSNVVLGMVLGVLYRLPTPINWFMVVLAGVSVVSTAALTYGVLSIELLREPRLIGLVGVLGTAAALTLNMTYTATAVLASVAGLSLVLIAAIRANPGWKYPGAIGVLLLLVGTLIRLRILALVLAFGLPGLALVFRYLETRRLVVMSALASLLIITGYAADRLYVHAAPDWNAFYAYNRLREQLHDSHRLPNMHNQIRRVGWTPNDQELFAHWFYPDPQRYSYENIRYLVDHTSGTSQDLLGTFIGYVRWLMVPELAPYFLLAAAIMLWLFYERSFRSKVWISASVLGVALAENLFLTWYYKDPDYVLISTLWGSLIFGFLLLTAIPGGQLNAANQAGRVQATGPWTRVVMIILVSGAAILTVAQSAVASAINIARQKDYAQIATDLRHLQTEGVIAENALIISPAHGLPFEWSNPFHLERPSVAYMDTGWMTFSPTYERQLRYYKIDPLPDALYLRDNVYLMTKATFTDFLGRYFEEHESTGVQFVQLYAMPNADHLLGYDEIYLYKLVRTR